MSLQQLIANRRDGDAPRTAVTIAAIERQIVRRLAELEGRDPYELQRELRLADRQLPVELGQLSDLLPVLESDFGVPLQGESRLELCLAYAHDLAVFIHRCLAATHAGYLGRMSQSHDLDRAA